MVQKSGKSPVEGKVVEIPLFTRLKIHPRVVQDFFHQQYVYVYALILYLL